MIFWNTLHNHLVTSSFFQILLPSASGGLGTMVPTIWVPPRRGTTGPTTWANVKAPLGGGDCLNSYLSIGIVALHYEVTKMYRLQPWA